MINARMTRNGKDASDLIAAFGFFGRKTGYIVADRGGRVAETVVSPLSNRIDAIFQAVIIRPWEGHGPS